MSYDGLQWDDLPEEIKESISAEAGAMAEGIEMDKRYKDLMELYAEIEERNQEFKRFYCTEVDNIMGEV